MDSFGRKAIRNNDYAGILVFRSRTRQPYIPVRVVRLAGYGSGSGSGYGSG